MIYSICAQPQSPRMDALPTYKILDYPLEPRDYKPFAQARLCMTPTELVLELWAFEMHPRPESRLEAVFTTQTAETLLLVQAWAEGEVRCVARTTKGERPLTVLSHSIHGEDLQGFYWGVTVLVPKSLLQELFGKAATQTGATLLGNLYKRSDSKEKPHSGSLHPADFASGREYALSSLGEFRFVNY